jgi:hypothetical protein
MKAPQPPILGDFEWLGSPPELGDLGGEKTVNSDRFILQFSSAIFVGEEHGVLLSNKKTSLCYSALRLVECGLFL